MKKLYTMFFMLLLGFSIEAQEVVSSGGETQSAGGYELSWTVGEVVTPTVHNNSNILTQGFHQSKLTITAIEEIVGTKIGLHVYPNPTSEFVTIHFDKLPGETAYSLFDINGKLLEQKNIATSNVKINMRSYSEGSYLLKLSDKNRSTQQTFKILKH